MFNIQKTAQYWEFASEESLEDFLWGALVQLLDIKPIKRQFSVSGQFCDILGITAQGSLAIVELKNGEDRYVVSQISRYYDALITEKPLSELIDYSQAIELIIIAPSFHRDNFIDQKYNRLNIRFLEFKLQEKGKTVLFSLKDLQSNIAAYQSIDLPDLPEDQTIATPPRRLLKLLADYDQKTKESILEVRSQILKFNPKIQEVSNTNNIIYGTGKTKSCAELRQDKVRNIMVLFLWLPWKTARHHKKQMVVRMRLWTDWETVSALGHTPDAMGKMVSFEEWESASVRPLNRVLPKGMSWRHDSWIPVEISQNKYFTDPVYRAEFIHQHRYLPHASQHNYRSGVAMSATSYLEYMGQSNTSLQLSEFVNLALETWLSKI
jgi:hypothetical protein